MKNLVYISYCAQNGADASFYRALKAHMEAYETHGGELSCWCREDSIAPGLNIAREIESAMNSSRVAVLLVSADYLARECWQEEAEPLLKLANRGHLQLLWQQISACHYDLTPLVETKQLQHNIILSELEGSKRSKCLKDISRLIHDAWKNAPTLSQRLAAMPFDEPSPIALSIAAARTPSDAVALVLTPSGEEKDATRCYQWGAFIQRTGEEQFQEIPNGEIGASPSFAKETLPELMQRLQRWIDSELEDVPVLEIFAPDDLLDEDWGGISIRGGEEPKFLHVYQPYLLRSSDRLLNRQWNARRGALKRMHRHLVKGTGAWLPQDQLTKLNVLDTLDGEALNPEDGEDVVSAICCLQANTLKNRSSWLKAVLTSMAPLVVWPSLKRSLGEERMQLCLRNLPLIQEDTGQDGKKVERPFCPDLVRLAKARRRWTHPDIDLRGLMILVDHPDRGPDRTTLQALFAPSREDPSPAPEGERHGPQPALLISS